MGEVVLIENILNGCNTVSDIVKNLLKHEQPDIKTTHSFHGGMYCRTFYPKENTFVVGKIHRFPGYNMLMKGEVTVYDGDTVTHHQAPCTFESKGNDQKVGYFTKDSEFAFVSVCLSDNVEDAEKELFYPDDTTIEQVKDWVDYQKMLLILQMTEDQVQEYVNLDNLIEGEISDFEIKDSLIHGKGFFTTKDYKKGDSIGYALIDGNRTELGRWVNNSAQPNTLSVKEDEKNGYAIALRDINAGEEITISYIKNMEVRL